MNSVGRRGKIRISSYIAFVLACLVAWGVTGEVKSRSYDRQLSVVRQRAVSSLASYLDTIETDLEKMQYANTPTMTSGLALSLAKASAGAKSCLAELSSGEKSIDTIYKFLSQAGDYIQSLSKKVTNGENLTDEEHGQIKVLYSYAGKLSKQISYMEEVMYTGSVDFEDAVSTLGSISDPGDLELSFSGAVSDAEDTFSDYPTLIYDGPFSDNILSKESDILKNEEEISEDEAKRRAAAYSGIQEKNLVRQEDESGRTSAYVFYKDGTSVAVTKNGGYLLYLLSDKTAGTAKIDGQTAIENARKYLEKFGYASMKDSYYSNNDGICTVNFAYTQDDVICYSDLIKVCVALDTGEIISADATGYIMNHKSRSIPKPKLSEAQAAENISSELTPKKCSQAIIPIDDGSEVFTYEFLCENDKGDDVLVYINADTGKEADIKLLMYSDGGVLTR